MYTYQQRKMSGNSSHYDLYMDGQILPFGAMFYGKRGDIKSLVVKAVNNMNLAQKQGKQTAVVTIAPKKFRSGTMREVMVNLNTTDLDPEYVD